MTLTKDHHEQAEREIRSVMRFSDYSDYGWESAKFNNPALCELISERAKYIALSQENAALRAEIEKHPKPVNMCSMGHYEIHYADDFNGCPICSLEAYCMRRFGIEEDSVVGAILREEESDCH